VSRPNFRTHHLHGSSIRPSPRSTSCGGFFTASAHQHRAVLPASRILQCTPRNRADPITQFRVVRRAPHLGDRVCRYCVSRRKAAGYTLHPSAKPHRCSNCPEVQGFQMRCTEGARGNLTCLAMISRSDSCLLAYPTTISEAWDKSCWTPHGLIRTHTHYRRVKDGDQGNKGISKSLKRSI